MLFSKISPINSSLSYSLLTVALTEIFFSANTLYRKFMMQPITDNYASFELSGLDDRLNTNSVPASNKDGGSISTVAKVTVAKVVYRFFALFIVLVISGIAINIRPTAAQKVSKVNELISFESQAGEKLLFTSQARRDFLPLSSEFVTQNHLAYCGVATIVMVLNALDIEAPEVPSHTMSGLASYRFFTQDNIFENPKARAVIEPETVKKQGIILQELGGLFQSYPLDAQVFHAKDTSVEQFRILAVQNLQQPKNFIVVNYYRGGLGQEGGGHISPLAAYNKQSDRFLILDVTRYRYQPVWVKTEALWKAMNTLDSTSGQSRGFVLINSVDAKQ